MKRIAIVLALALLPAPALADGAANGNDFVQRCHNNNMALWCIGYARGIADGFEVWKYVLPNKAPICIDRDVQASALIDVAVTYIWQHPEARTASAGSLLAAAFFEAWPCASR
jgi:Rap1a immunity proteins